MALNSCKSTIIRHITFLITANIICIPKYFMLVLLHLSLSTMYLSLFKKKMSNLLTWIVIKIDFFLSLVIIYIILFKYRKLVQVTLNIVSMFRSWSNFISLPIIFLKIFFIIGNYIFLILKNNILSSLIIHVKQRLSKIFRVIW